MPLSITLDPVGNAWVTDAATHQVKRFADKGKGANDLTVGVRVREYHRIYPACGKELNTECASEIPTEDTHCKAEIGFSP